MLAKRLTQWLIKTYLNGLLIELPDLSDNPGAIKEIASSADSALRNSADIYVDGEILHLGKERIIGTTKTDFDIAFNRGVIWAIKLRKERLTQLKQVHEKPKQEVTAKTISRNHG